MESRLRQQAVYNVCEGTHQIAEWVPSILDPIEDEYYICVYPTAGEIPNTPVDSVAGRCPYTAESGCLASFHFRDELNRQMPDDNCFAASFQAVFEKCIAEVVRLRAAEDYVQHQSSDKSDQGDWFEPDVVVVSDAKALQPKGKLLTIPVPKGCKGGDVVRIAVDGRLCSVHIPANCIPGGTFCITAPQFSTADTDVKKITVQVTVPKDKGPKDMVSFNGPGDKLCTVIIPKNLHAGDTFNVTLPSVVAESAKVVKQSEGKPRKIKITVPAGAKDGDEMTVYARGRTVQIALPAGIVSGDSMLVEI